VAQLNNASQLGTASRLQMAAVASAAARIGIRLVGHRQRDRIRSKSHSGATNSVSGAAEAARTLH
jgi:hypothetical protein